MINLLSAFGAGVCYRLGGTGGNWNTKWRDIGVPLFICLSMPLHWSLLICFLLSFGSMTTYWKKKGTDAEWWNWALTGFFYTLAYLPYFWLTNNLVNWVLCCVIVTTLITLWSEIISLDWLEEFGRGFILTLGLLYSCRILY
jgi:hypothetical protein